MKMPSVEMRSVHTAAIRELSVNPFHGGQVASGGTLSFEPDLV